MALNLGGWEWVIFWFMLSIFVICGGIVTFWILYRLRWKFEWRILENIAGFGYIPTRKGRCRLVGIGEGGEEIFYLKGIKKYKAGYGKRIGAKQIAWAIGEDGYWYNVTFGNLDKKLREIGVMPVDKDMRYAYASIRKIIDKRFDDKSFMEKYGPMIAIGLIIIAILVQGVTTYYIQKKVNEGLAINAQAVEAQQKVMELSERVLSNVANIQSGGSGYRT